MSDYSVNLIQRYSRVGVIFDTNILLLYFVGTYNQDLIPKFKRTKIFTVEDYNLLVGLLGRVEKIITTPNILTEVSNLSGQLSENLKFDYFEKFATGIALLDEHYLSSDEISRMDEFSKFGLTDAGILHIARGNYLVITDDFRLSQYLQKIGVDALNFNHIRTFNWDQ